MNGFEEETGFKISGVINTSLQNLIKKFQEFSALEQTGKADSRTWASLLTSCGDTSRPAIACDCATIITDDNVEVLKNNGYKYVGRYLSGYVGNGVNKALSTEELQILFNNGIRVFPIHQGSANYSAYFTEENAVKDAESAYEYAEKLHLQFGAIIYFAVDCDLMDYQITSLILPYFKKLYSTFMTKSRGKYRVGVYGTRNLCTRVCNAGYACSSFVGNISTGWSGNLGFKMPDNWALDQFTTTKISSNGRTIEIDKDGFSGQYEGISQEYFEFDNCYDERDDIGSSFIFINRSETPLPVYSLKEHYNHPIVTAGSQFVTAGEKIGEIKPNDFYVFIGLKDPAYDTIHRVIFNDGKDTKYGFINGYPDEPPISETDNRKRNYYHKPLYHEPFSRVNFNPETKKYFTDTSQNSIEFQINKPVVFFDTIGNYEGTLKEGDKVTISYNNMNNTGVSRPWCYRVDKITFKEGNSVTNKYVSTGLENGASGTDRAWY